MLVYPLQLWVVGPGSITTEQSSSFLATPSGKDLSIPRLSFLCWMSFFLQPCSATNTIIMSDQKVNVNDSSMNNLNIMAAAAEHISSAAAMATTADTTQGACTTVLSPPTRRPKLVLPNLTPAMQQDLALAKGSGGKSSKPLSIGTRPEFADYPLKGIVTPHPNDVCKCQSMCADLEFLSMCPLSQVAHIMCHALLNCSVRPWRRFKQPSWE